MYERSASLLLELDLKVFFEAGLDPPPLLDFYFAWSLEERVDFYLAIKD